MKLTQISVFLENKKGRLLEVCSLLGEGAVNIRALTIAESEGYGVLRMVVNRPQEAMRLLKSKAFVANLTDIVAVQVEDKPGGLASVLKVINDQDINVEYMYGFVEKFSERALMVFRFEDPDKAIAALTKNNVKVVSKEEMVNL